jgi:TrpR family trp operon transcriptional repressor
MRAIKQKYWKMFLELCLQTESTSRLEDLFNLFFTIEEKEHLSSRMRIIKALLDQKLSQREISEKMKVSISQITRGSNALKTINNDFLKFVENYVRNQI